ncbi:DsbA family oxidoreductase [Alkalicoccobacillus murimartini]|uniref:DsbA family dithiol-disulfide isomerase n=1 Tax=Alkalicoccobacillus murimartini TaxID=171685 RepID=A0ABT9YIZ5_9BACI|nr:DsbA family oxidoreductase [Alkalicoccobacillus murimartini]MDQ0207177.1 putative DsbA family dithiol-disulfide isomerase [Alkalicoccobacillus murimartini]
MNIEIWSDFACPFCYIGKRKLEQALEQFEHKAQVTTEFKSFELDPNAAKHTDKSMAELLAGKYKMPLRQAEAMTANVAAQAADVGLTYHFDTMQPTNMLDAHRLTHYAKTQGKANELAERLLYAYFTESKHLSTPDTLIELAGEVGLVKEEVAKVLESDQFADAVKYDHNQGVQLGLQGVPFFVINQKHVVSGAQQSSAFLEALTTAWNEEKAQKTSTENTDDACADGLCKF